MQILKFDSVKFFAFEPNNFAKTMKNVEKNFLIIFIIILVCKEITVLEINIDIRLFDQ